MKRRFAAALMACLMAVALVVPANAVQTRAAWNVPKLDFDERVCLVGYLGQGAFEFRLRPSTIASGVRGNMEGEMPESRF